MKQKIALPFIPKSFGDELAAVFREADEAERMVIDTGLKHLKVRYGEDKVSEYVSHLERPKRRRGRP